MTRLTEGMVIGRTKASDLNNVRSLNCWGSELSDVSLVRQMTNVEVLSLSVNKITTLEDFGHCPNLVELYVRKNMIKDLSEIIYLQELPKLKNLWLEDNPCAAGDRYRVTVLKYLPNLKKLDNILVEPDEVKKAATCGEILGHPSDLRLSRDVSPPPKIKSEQLSSSPPHHSKSPDNKFNDLDVEGNAVISGVNNATIIISPGSISSDVVLKQESQETKFKDRRQSLRGVIDAVEITPQNANNDYSTSYEEGRPMNRMGRRSIPEMGAVTPTTPTEKRIAIASPIESSDLRTEQQASSYNQHQPGVQPASAPYPAAAAPPSAFHQAHAYPQASAIRPNAYLEDTIQAPQQQQPHQSHSEYNQYRYPPNPLPHQLHGQQSNIGIGGCGGVAALHNPLHGHNFIQQRQFFEKVIGDLSNKPYSPNPARPKNRNSNILSAVLCLIKELDCASLEVVEMAVRCRMDELD